MTHPEGAGESRPLLLARVSNAVEWARVKRSCVVTVILSEAEQDALLSLLASAPAPSAEREPTDVEVNAAIDSLANDAKARYIGTTGHTWGAHTAIDRNVALLKAALAAPLPPAEPPQQGNHE